METVESAPKLVLNTTVLSNFLAAECLHLLNQLPTPIVACSAVLKEVQAGMQVGKLPRVSLEWLPVVQLSPDEAVRAEQLRRRLGAGEAESIAVAVSRGWAFATDDWIARRTAVLLGIPITGTIGILTELTNQAVLSLIEANACLRAMIQRGYRSPVQELDPSFFE